MVKKLPIFVELAASLPCSGDPNTRPYPELSNSQPYTQLLVD